MLEPWRHLRRVALMRTGVIVMLCIAIMVGPDSRIPEQLKVSVLLSSNSGISADQIRQRLALEINDSATLHIETAVSDMQAAFSDTLWRLDSAQRNAIIVVSDGRWGADLAGLLAQAGESDIPVFWMPPDTSGTESSIVGVSAPAVAEAGELVGIAVDVRLAEPADLVLIANGMPVQRRSVAQSGIANFEFVVPQSGPLTVGAELFDAEGDISLSRLEPGALVNVSAMPSILLLSNDASLFGDSLRSGGWSVTQISTSQLGSSLNVLASFSALVLDNIAVSDLAESAWLDIAHAVRNDGMGLLALGGPRAFGLGGYRASTLESLLPVVSEPPANESPASIMFLIDVSGSMEGGGLAARRLQIARQAVLETTSAMRPTDRIGLMTFAIDPTVLLLPEARVDHVQSITENWPRQASGGTRLLPSLQLAIDTLQAEDSQQKLLVLLTDGLLADDGVQNISAVLRGNDIDLIGLLISNQGQSGLELSADLRADGRSRLLRIDDVLRLPVLMRREVEQLRPAVVSGASQPVEKAASALLPLDSAWPPIAAYSLTRPRTGARIQLESARGDVLIASRTAGAGRSTVLTSGFSGWTERWLQWPLWPEVAAGLVNDIAASGSGGPAIAIQRGAGEEPLLLLSYTDRQLHETEPVVTITNPAGTTNAIALRLQGPGEYAASLQLNGYGQFALTVADRGLRSRHRFLNERMNSASPGSPPVAEKWQQNGLLERWSAGVLDNRAVAFAWRTLLSGLAGLFFVLVLAGERLAYRLPECVRMFRKVLRRALLRIQAVAGKA
jgi:hypothetical protein